MPSVRTSSWHLSEVVDRRVFQSADRKVRFYVHIRRFLPPNDRNAVVTPASHLGPQLFAYWVMCCRSNSRYAPDRKAWVWPVSVLEQHLTDVAPTTESMRAPSIAPSEEDLAAAKARRKALSDNLDSELLQLTKLENVPPEQWPSYHYPLHYRPTTPLPTALQRIIVSKYWKRHSFMLIASVGTGKSRMWVDICNARMLSEDVELQNSVRIQVVVAPATLHDNWAREFTKWSPPSIQWHVHKFLSGKSPKFWAACEQSAEKLFTEPPAPGGIVILTTPQAWSRTTFASSLQEHHVEPTMIVIDEVHKLFRNPNNSAFKNLLETRRVAHGCVALTGTPTSRAQDWWPLEEVVGGSDSGYHWGGADYELYVRAFNPEDRLNCTPLVPERTPVATALKAFHSDRIKRGQAFMALKEHYMADALPGLDQAELGLFAEQRFSFTELCEKFPDDVAAALALQQARNPEWDPARNESTVPFVILTRLQQIAGVSDASQAILREFVEEFLEPEEPAVVWTLYKEEQAQVAEFLSAYGPVVELSGETPRNARQGLVDAFQEGRARFFVANADAGGVGITLTRACKNFFNTSPMSYLNMAQAVGRLHRIGQTKDVVSYFSMAHPVSGFVRSIHDKRTEVNELLPKRIAGIIPQVPTGCRKSTIHPPPEPACAPPPLEPLFSGHDYE